MSELYKEHSPNIKDVKECHECGAPVTQDIYQRQLEKGKRLIEAIACDDCKIIYEVLED